MSFLSKACTLSQLSHNLRVAAASYAEVLVTFYLSYDNSLSFAPLCLHQLEKSVFGLDEVLSAPCGQYYTRPA